MRTLQIHADREQRLHVPLPQPEEIQATAFCLQKVRTDYHGDSTLRGWEVEVRKMTKKIVLMAVVVTLLLVALVGCTVNVTQTTITTAPTTTIISCTGKFTPAVLMNPRTGEPAQYEIMWTPSGDGYIPPEPEGE